MHLDKRILMFGLGYSIVISFSLFGPIQQVIYGDLSFIHSIISLLAFIFVFATPVFHKLSKSILVTSLFSSMIMIMFGLYPYFSTMIFAFSIAAVCRYFTLHVFHLGEAEVEMSKAFFIAFMILYFLNVTVPDLSVIASKVVLLLLVSVLTLVLSYQDFLDMTTMETKKGSTKISNVALLLIYIGGGITYAGIYPHFEAFSYVDRFYNVLPFIITMPIAAYVGKKHGNIYNLYFGVLSLCLAFVSFLFDHTIFNYFITQTCLQIGWGFVNVFGFAYSWTLAKKSDYPQAFGNGLVFILVGVFIGSIISLTLEDAGVPVVFFAPFTFIPIVISLIIFSHPTVYSNNIPSRDEDNFLNVLTKREKEIVMMYLEGSTSDVAEKLFISNNTVKTHVKHIYKKLNVSSKDELRELFE